MSRSSLSAGWVPAALLCAAASAAAAPLAEAAAPVAEAAAPVAEAAAPVAEFLYVDASEAGASGGHVALRLADHVYHFQQDASGNLAIARHSWSDFDFEYRVVGNRSVHATRIPAAAGEREQLRRHFDEQVLLEATERRRIDALRDDVALLEALAAPDEAAFALRGAGFFAAGRQPLGPARRAATAALAGLRERIEGARGAGFLEARRREAAASLRGLHPEASETGGGSALDSYPFSQRYTDAFVAQRALEVLRDAPPLRRDALRALPGADAPLSAEERTALARRAAELETELAGLVASRRPDWGSAFLLGAARLAALAESLASGELRLLDALPAAAPRLRASALPAGALEPRLAWRRARLAAARRDFVAGPRGARAQARLEATASRYAELAAARAPDGVLRLPRGPLLPRAHARVTPLPRPAFADGDPGAHLDRARDRLARAEAERAERRGYDLVTRNCVTELFQELDAALGAADGPAPGPAGPLAFVPFVAERAVRADWAGERVTHLSYRRDALADASAGVAGWLAGLRESNTLTSSLYRSHDADSIFLFFTDDTLLARPVLGAANLAAGLVGATAGLARLPWQGPSMITRGLRGSAASLPELFFFNVRKGTFPLAVPVDPPAAPGDAD